MAPRSTLPVLCDPNAGALVTGSFDIAVYLDNTYQKDLFFPRISWSKMVLHDDEWKRITAWHDEGR
ncbi:hypothetical protein SCLCIDRAFT_1207270 [Scleroderma citrinum Foug A]|uniref:GST N-terminal domain-containing protein n=1 Tax=Scleroderma citrinum Foug A TaxID=1036808 RepID=A0A0C3EQ84_9AGAM|nr:hypothetical protein SCLCIDRAFT_1207270 [Scleroderma citrinum Foug A]